MKYLDFPLACVILTRYFAVLKQPDHYEPNKKIPMLIEQFS